MLFIAIFFSKMVISVAPVIFHLDNKVVKAVIMQLESESKEKDTAEKDICKEKKSFDEYYTQLVRFNLHVIEVNILHNQETLIYHYAYSSNILTPPPNA